MRRAWLLVPALLGAPLAAQVEVGVQALGYFVRQSTPSDATSQSGNWAGLEGRVALGGWTLLVRGVTGSLSGTGLSRDVRMTGITVRRRLSSWIALGLDAEADRRASDQDIEVWRLYGLGATARAGLGVPGLRVIWDVTVFPLANQVASRDISGALRSEVALRYAAPRWPVEAQLGYRFENVGFSEGVDLRYGAVVLGAGVRFGQAKSR